MYSAGEQVFGRFSEVLVNSALIQTKMADGEVIQSSAKTPADFLKSIKGKPVVVKLNSGVDYRGVVLDQAATTSLVAKLGFVVHA